MNENLQKLKSSGHAIKDIHRPYIENEKKAWIYNNKKVGFCFHQTLVCMSLRAWKPLKLA